MNDSTEPFDPAEAFASRAGADDSLSAGATDPGSCRVEAPELADPPRPRIVTALVVPLISLVTFFGGSMVVLVLVALLVHGQIDREQMRSAEGLEALSSSRVGFPLMVVLPQLALVIPCLIAAALSPVPFRKRLSLVRGHWPLWAWVAAAFATPLVGWISSIIVGSLMTESENLKMMSDIFRGHGESGFLIPLAILIGLTPAICEELLFRGYVQTRLCRAVGPLLGITVSSALFAAFHLDWVHSIAVFPLGMFLGFIAWRSGSLFPAMLGHFVNNSISVVAVVLSPVEKGEMPSADMVLFLLIVMAAAFSGAVMTGVAVWTQPGPADGQAEPQPLGPAGSAI